MQSSVTTVVVRADTSTKKAQNHIAQLRSGEVTADKLSKSELMQVVNILLQVKGDEE